MAMMAGARSGQIGKGRFALRQNAEINVTPFVDVMLVLLIVMMVTAPLATVAVNLDMPPTAKAAPTTPPTFLSVTEHGLYLTTGPAARQTSLAALPADLGRALGAPSAHPRVMLRADRHVAYGKFMAVVNTLKAAGYDRIGLISEDLN